VESIKGINFFGLSGGSPWDGVDLYYLNGGVYELVDSKDYGIEYMGLNLSGDNRTNVYSLTFDDAIETNGFKFVFDEFEDRDYVYLREIGFWKEMEEEYEDYLESYDFFEEIVESRNECSSIYSPNESWTVLWIHSG